MSIKIIACLDMGFGIGDGNGDLLFRLPRDLQHFKSITTGKTVVMGRSTWESLPESVRPLPKRKNFILTRDESYIAEGAKVLHSIEEVLELSKSKDVFVIGGQSVYEQFIPYTKEMYLTHVHAVNINSTTFFPNYETKDWKIVSMNKNESEGDSPSFTFARYIRIDNNEK